VFGSNQDAAFASHTHTGTTGVQSNDHSHSTFAGAYRGLNGSGNRGWSSGDSQDGSANISSGGQSASHTHSFTTAATGGTETRPINIALLPVIKV